MREDNFRRNFAHYLRLAQLNEELDARSENRDPKTIDLDTPVTLRMLAKILYDPQGYAHLDAQDLPVEPQPKGCSFPVFYMGRPLPQ